MPGLEFIPTYTPPPRAALSSDKLLFQPPGHWEGPRLGGGWFRGRGGCGVSVVPTAAGLTLCLCRCPGPGAAAAGGRGPRAPAPAPAPGGPRALPDVPSAALRAAHRLPGRVCLRRGRGGRRRKEQQQELQHRRPAAEGPQARRGSRALTRFRPASPTPPRPGCPWRECV